MFLQIAIENHRSIAEKQVISFLAVEGEDHPQGQCVEVEGVGKVLRSIVLYGANASGKTTVIDAVESFWYLVREGVRPGKRIPHDPFRLDPRWRAAPTRIEVVVVAGGHQWGYGIAFSSTAIVEEWLVLGPQEVVVFERTLGEDQKPRVGFGPGLKEFEREKPEGFFELVVAGTRREQPFLTELREREVGFIVPLWEKILLMVDFADSDEEFAYPNERPFLGVEQLEFTTSLLRAAGTGVVGVRLASDDPVVAKRVAEEATGHSGQPQEWTKDELSKLHLEFLHEGRDGQQWFLEDELSDGTRRLLAFAIPLRDASDLFVAIDELDRSLHTQLARHVLQLFNRAGSRGQLLATVHDTNLLDANVLGRDGIWFVQKDAHGATKLYSLTEFNKEQLDALTGRVEQSYLDGRFGAVPLLSEPLLQDKTEEEG